MYEKASPATPQGEVVQYASLKVRVRGTYMRLRTDFHSPQITSCRNARYTANYKSPHKDAKSAGAPSRVGAQLAAFAQAMGAAGMYSKRPDSTATPPLDMSKYP